jgi:hypothetical protein
MLAPRNRAGIGKLKRESTTLTPVKPTRTHHRSSSSSSSSSSHHHHLIIIIITTLGYKIKLIGPQDKGHHFFLVYILKYSMILSILDTMWET